MYKPPFSVNMNMLNMVISITEKLGKIDNYNSLKRMPTLRRNNKIRSIHSSLAIEANSLSLGQVKDVINGKTVIGPQKEILEVKNAYTAYDNIKNFNPYKENDLLEAHKILTIGIEDTPGKYRLHPEGVFDGDKVIFIAPSENIVPQLMNNLFDWLNNDNETPLLIKSCIFHYEFVFIHPFGDGNGRTARLWQNVILTKWNPIFEYLPIESMILKYQNEYYDSINKSNNNGESNIFIEFMLKMINETLDETLENIKRTALFISEQVNKLLSVMEDGISYSANELLNMLSIKSKDTLRNTYLKPAIENGLVYLTIPDKPNSKNQKYYKE